MYHLYYGNETGSPGTILTFFPYHNLPRGRKGTGQLTYTAFSVPTASLSFWMDRLQAQHIPFSGPDKRFSEMYLRFEDYDGAGIELIFNHEDQRPGCAHSNQIPVAYAIRGFHSVTLNELMPDPTIHLFTETMQHTLVGEEQGRFRFMAGLGGPGNYIDVLHSPTHDHALPGAGSVHHVAFSTDSEATQLTIQTQLTEAGFHPTAVVDRQYFQSIYFREPGGILFEVATNSPGFTIDEPLAELGTSLKLPPQYELRRASLEAALPTISIN